MMCLRTWFRVKPMEGAAHLSLLLFQVEESVPSLSLQINVPVLSLSLSVLFILAAVGLCVALRRKTFIYILFAFMLYLESISKIISPSVQVEKG